MSKKKYSLYKYPSRYILIFDYISIFVTRFFWILFLCNSTISILLFDQNTALWLHFSDKTTFPLSILQEWIEKSGIIHWYLFGSLQYLGITLIWSTILLVLTDLRTKVVSVYSTLFFISIAILSKEYPLALFNNTTGYIGSIISHASLMLFSRPFNSFIALLIAIISLLKIFNYSFVSILQLLAKSLWSATLFSCIYALHGLQKLVQIITTSLRRKKKKDLQNNTISQVTQPTSQKPTSTIFKKKYSFIGCFKPHPIEIKYTQEEIEKTAKILEETLAFFGIHGSVEKIHTGPVVSLFEYAPQLGSKISKIIALEHDLALKLKAPSIRIIAPIPGKSVIGFEIAHHTRNTVYFSNLITNRSINFSEYQIPLILGVDTLGNPAIIDLPTTPHLLIAGSTGSGKSVGMHSIITSIITLHRPEQIKLIMIDPKRLEFGYYNDIPHLLFPLINDASKAINALKWLVKEMEQRYILLSKNNVRNISDYHALHQESIESLPFIIVLIDELADLMMVAGKEIEIELARLAQMARAAGIFLIVATQRPSVDVVTGLIKVNFPSRIAYRVTSKIDSRTILDQMGAEKLLGKGDLLLLHATSTMLQRIHGPYISNKEIIALATAVKTYGKPEYILLADEPNSLSSDDTVENDTLYQTIKIFIQSLEEVSISQIQRNYRIGFNRSARIIDQLEKEGLIGPAQGSKPRKVL